MATGNTPTGVPPAEPSPEQLEAAAAELLLREHTPAGLPRAGSPGAVQPKQFADAVWAGDLPAVEAMLAAGADPDAADGDREPPLHLAIEQQHLPIVRRLIAAGATLSPQSGGWTPLAHAIDIESDAAWQRYHEPDRESTELTELLLAAGAAPDEEAFRVAQAYNNRQALAVLGRHARQAEPGAAADRPRD